MILKKSETFDVALLILKRYTLKSFDKPIQWQRWYEKNKNRFYFSDVGGFKFRIIPDGY